MASLLLFKIEKRFCFILLYARAYICKGYARKQQINKIETILIEIISHNNICIKKLYFLYKIIMIMLPRYTLTLTNLVYSTYEFLRGPFPKRKSFEPNFSRGSRRTCHGKLTAQLIIIERFTSHFVVSVKQYQKKLEYKNPMIIILIHERNIL